MEKDSKQALTKAAGTQVGTGCGCWDGPVKSLSRGGDILARGQYGVAAQEIAHEQWLTSPGRHRSSHHGPCALPSQLCFRRDFWNIRAGACGSTGGPQRTGRTGVPARQALPVTSCVTSGKPLAAHRQLSQSGLSGAQIGPPHVRA